MAVTPKSLALNDQIAGTSDAATDTLYTANNGTAQIDAFTAINTSVSAVDISIYILPSGVAATAASPVIVSVPANSQVIIADLIGHKIPKSGSIEAFAGTTNVLRVIASGVEFT
jgi:hypothetical protein